MNRTLVKTCLAAVLIIEAILAIAYWLPSSGNTELIQAYASFTISKPAMTGETERCILAMDQARNPSAVQFLARNIDWHGNIIIIGFEKNDNDVGRLYPVAHALVSIGPPAVPAILQNVETEMLRHPDGCGPSRTLGVCAWTLKSILGADTVPAILEYAAKHPDEAVNIRRFAKDFSVFSEALNGSC